MGVVYSMYDALVSINVPDEKAKAVIDALEREMMDKLATKADLAHVKELLSSDIRALETSTRAELVHLREVMATKVELAELGKDLTTKLYFAVGGSTALTISVLGILMKLS
jgi:hypothetical protein